MSHPAPRPQLSTVHEGRCSSIIRLDVGGFIQFYDPQEKRSGKSRETVNQLSGYNYASFYDKVINLVQKKKQRNTTEEYSSVGSSYQGIFLDYTFICSRNNMII